jgi:hypothetical protein
LAEQYRQNPNIVARAIGGEMILVPIRHDVSDLHCIYSLNEVGAFIWGRLDGTRATADLVDSVRGEFDASADEAERDLTEFLGQLAAIGAIDAIDATNAIAADESGSHEL